MCHSVSLTSAGVHCCDESSAGIEESVAAGGVCATLDRLEQENLALRLEERTPEIQSDARATWSAYERFTSVDVGIYYFGRRIRVGTMTSIVG